MTPFLRVINIFFKFVSFSIVARSNCSLRDVHTSYVISTPKIMLKTSSFMVPRNHEMRSPLLIHSCYYGLGLLFPSSSFISSTSFFPFNRWWRTLSLWTKGVIWLRHNKKFVEFNLIEMKLEHWWKDLILSSGFVFGLQVYGYDTM